MGTMLIASLLMLIFVKLNLLFTAYEFETKPGAFS